MSASEQREALYLAAKELADYVRGNRMKHITEVKLIAAVDACRDIDRASAAPKCEDCGGELVRGSLDRSGQDYWCPTCTKAAIRADRAAPAGQAEREPVAWIVQAVDAPESPRYLVWKRDSVGMARQDQCTFTPLYTALREQGDSDLRGSAAQELPAAAPAELSLECGAIPAGTLPAATSSQQPEQHDPLPSAGQPAEWLPVPPSHSATCGQKRPGWGHACDCGFYERHEPYSKALRAAAVAEVGRLNGELVDLGNRYDRVVENQRMENYEELLDSREKWAAACNKNEQSATDAESALAAMREDAGRLWAALTELLRLYDWRNQLAAEEKNPVFGRSASSMKRTLNQYGREKKAAWEVAREALAARTPGEAR